MNYDDEDDEDDEDEEEDAPIFTNPYPQYHHSSNHHHNLIYHEDACCSTSSSSDNGDDDEDYYDFVAYNNHDDHDDARGKSDARRRPAKKQHQQREETITSYTAALMKQRRGAWEQGEKKEAVVLVEEETPPAPAPAPTLTVIGLYGRCRHSYHRPTTSSTSTSTSNNHQNQNDDDSDLQAPPVKPHQFMPRRRLKTKKYNYCNNHGMNNGNNDDDHAYDHAHFEPVHGLINHDFWHMAPNEEDGYLFEERAILFQAMEHYDLIADAKLDECNAPLFASSLTSTSTSTISTYFDDYLTTPYFGEQVIVKGLDSSQICIGDVFEVKVKYDANNDDNDANNDENIVSSYPSSSLRIEITSPRKPCYYVDKRNGTSLGSKGMKRYTLTHSLAGWFARVIQKGELCDGMELVRTKHPHPKWTLTYLSQVLYGEGNKTAMMTCKPFWSRDKSELIELLQLKQLAEYEWKAEARKILMNHRFEEQTRWGYYSSSSSSSSRSITLTIRGIYGREDIPRYEELPPNYSVHDMEKDQFMSRYKYLTKPLDEPPSDSDDDKYDYANFVPSYGLKGQWTNFQHTNYKETKSVFQDRAILFQSTEHYETLWNDPKFKDCFNDTNHDYLQRPTFGEQVIIEGCNSSQIAIGDIFQVENELSSLIIEVTAPRKPGDTVDYIHHGRTMGQDGIKHHSLVYGLGGWFTRVLVAGELKDGMKLIRTKNPNPKWTLVNISRMLYGNGDDIIQWNGTRNELLEIINLPQLGESQWKEEGEALLKSWDERNVIRGPSNTRPNFLGRTIEFVLGASLCYCDGIETLMACAAGADDFNLLS